MISIALVDDHTLSSEVIGMHLNELPIYKVLFTAKNGQAMIEKMDPANLPDIIIVDFHMPIMNGVATTKWLSKNHPSCKVIAMSMDENPMSIEEMLAAGAKTYLPKKESFEELQVAINQVMKTGCYINAEVNAIIESLIAIPNENDPKRIAQKLSSRERIFLQDLSEEKSFKQIAADMGVSHRTIDGYRDKLFKKLKVHSRLELIVFAYKYKVITID